MLVCPICKKELKKENNVYCCFNRHSFDIAKQGYVNLSLKQKKNQGDNALMVQARTQFLEKNYYDFIRRRLCELLNENACRFLLDLGCGQGYYTSKFSEIVSNVYGVDLSKSALKYASAHDKKTTYIVDSIFNLPFSDASFDAVTAIFVPISVLEVQRVLQKDGLFIVVGPGPRHCWELKEILYEKPYENPVPSENMEGFTCVKQEKIQQQSWVDDVWSLLEMTPYRYKTSQEGLERVKQLEGLHVTFEFMVSIWKKD